MIFCPLVHILDMLFLLLSIFGVVLEFTLLRSATSTDEVSIYIATLELQNLQIRSYIRIATCI